MSLGYEQQVGSKVVDELGVNCMGASDLVERGDLSTILKESVLHAEDRLFEQTQFFLELSVRLLVSLLQLHEEVHLLCLPRLHCRRQLHFAFLALTP